MTNDNPDPTVDLLRSAFEKTHTNAINFSEHTGIPVPIIRRVLHYGLDSVPPDMGKRLQKALNAYLRKPPQP